MRSFLLLKEEFLSLILLIEPLLEKLEEKGRPILEEVNHLKSGLDSEVALENPKKQEAFFTSMKTELLKPLQKAIRLTDQKNFEDAHSKLRNIQMRVLGLSFEDNTSCPLHERSSPVCFAKDDEVRDEYF